jgi:hypothetical protein
MYPIFFTEKNIHGAWVVYGANGIKQYYYMTKSEAEKLYKEETAEKIFIEKRKRGEKE